MSEQFGTPDPSVALSPAPTPAPKPGPLHQVEFVLEIVGPKSIPAGAAAELLKPEWQGPLGAPRIWVMAPQDTEWQSLTPSVSGSYDSLVLSWPYIGRDGHLTSRSAITLAGTAERFATSVQRRALSMPPPNDVDNSVRSIHEIAERLDIGVSASVAFDSHVPEERLWRSAVELGLSLNGQGEFVWGDPAQATVVPLQKPYQFALSGVRSGRLHEGLTVGFSAPLTVNPIASLRASLYVADEYARRHGGFVFGEDGDPLTPRLRAEYEESLGAAIAAFSQVGLVSGSPEAFRLFSP